MPSTPLLPRGNSITSKLAGAGGFPSSSASSPTSGTKSYPAKMKQVTRKPVFYIPVLALAALLYIVVLSPPLGARRTDSANGASTDAFVTHDYDFTARLQNTFGHKLSNFGIQREGRRGGRRRPFGRPGRPQLPSATRSEFECNPFAATGRLHVDTVDPTSNVWTPFDSHCRPSNYMSALYRAPGDESPLIPSTPPLSDGASRHTKAHQREFLPWLMNKTVVIHGDSIDRYHLKDFCAFVGGRLDNIAPDHAASPAPYRAMKKQELGPDGEETPESKKRRTEREALEAMWEARPTEGHQLTSPWVCDVEEYGLTLVSVFTWGMFGAEEFFQTERWYHPPATWVDRFQAITLPLLDGLAKAYNRPQIRHPDLVEINSGFWDLRKWTEEDFVANGFATRPYPEDSPIPYTNLSPERELAWEKEARRGIKTVARAFKGDKSGSAKDGPVVLWRTLHHPPRHNYAPFPRVFALDSLARKVVSDLTISPAPPPYLFPSSTPTSSSFESEADLDTEDLGLDERLRIDESGAVMLGQEHHFRDLLHPEAVPGSWVWGDVMLYELKRAVLKIGRS